MIDFTLTPEESETINKIAMRATQIAKDCNIKIVPLKVMMDITAVHKNDTPLRLTELLDATAGNFTHDVFGIIGNIDRNTGKLAGHFSPRYMEVRG